MDPRREPGETAPPLASGERDRASGVEAGAMVSTNLRLVRQLGEGGMGSVWVADHLALKTQVVVKFMSADLAASPEAAQRFSREAAAAAQVKSPHVVQTLDHGVSVAGAPYIVMELLEGRDLAEHLADRGRLPPSEVSAIVSQLARALTKAHAAGIVHRDIKPNNIFLCDAGSGELFVKLLDFGIAKSQALSLLDASTRTGSFVGSPYYMSPEQVIGEKTIASATDLWSLGVVAFEALTGTKPFFAETVGGLAIKIHRDPLPVPSQHDPGLPAALDEWFRRACAREASGRFSSAKEMAEALAAAVSGEGAAYRSSDPPAPRPAAVSPFASTALAGSRGGVESAKAVSNDSGTEKVRVETNSGVGLSSRVLPRRRITGKVIGIAAGAVVLVGAVIVLPRLMAGTTPPAQATAEARATTGAPTGASSARANVSASRGETLANAEPISIATTSASPPPPASSEPATAKVRVPGVVTGAGPGTGIGAAVHPRTTTSAVSVATSAPTTPPTPPSATVKAPKPPDDDGIK